MNKIFIFFALLFLLVLPFCLGAEGYPPLYKLDHTILRCVNDSDCGAGYHCSRTDNLIIEDDACCPISDKLFTEFDYVSGKCTKACLDNDSDGYGNGCSFPDCDDTNPAVNYGAQEVKDGVDNDCDDLIDEGLDMSNSRLKYGSNLTNISYCLPYMGVSNGCLVDGDCRSNEYCDTVVNACVEGARPCNSESDCNSAEICSDGFCSLPSFVLLLFPGNEDYTKEGLFAEKEHVVSAFTNGLDFNDCKERVKVIIGDVCEGVDYGECSEKNALATTYCFFGNDSDMRYYYYQNVPFIMLGLGKHGMGVTAFSSTQGVSCGNGFPGFMFLNTGSDKADVIIAHEIAHRFGLVDEYCYNPPGNDKCPSGYCGPNPTDPKFDGNEISSSDFWWQLEITWNIRNFVYNEHYCSEKFGWDKEVLGNKWNYPEEGRSIMSDADAPGPRAWDYYDKEHLNAHYLLQCEGET